MILPYQPRPLPDALAALTELVLDLRWTWSHAGDALWRRLDPEAWTQLRNPWVTLQELPEGRLDRLAGDPGFLHDLERLREARAAYVADPGWYGTRHADAALHGVAYFSMEFGLSEALPLYAGGLGVLAGDYLKTASDLNVPVVGVGLLYQEGYFRQVLDADGRQQEFFPYNNPNGLPVQPVRANGGGWLHVPVELPGRTLLLRVWEARVGRVMLYLLDSNDPINGPADRGITSKLYPGEREIRLLQSFVLGVGGWRALEALGIDVDVCHINEGHGAFAFVERARRYVQRTGVGFREALWATRPGNVFTTHTPVPAGFDTFSPELIGKYFHGLEAHYGDVGLKLGDLLALGRHRPGDASEPLNMAYLAVRLSRAVNGVSRLHASVSRRLFAPLFPGWPAHEVPVSHVTNGVHVPSWDSAWADEIWTKACGKERWRGSPAVLSEAIATIPDEELWEVSARERADLVHYARARLARQLGQRGSPPQAIAAAAHVLDPNVLTLGFARRFTEYKRPNLLLHDPERLARLLTDPDRPVQLVVAGKAHPEDGVGKRLVQAWARFAQRADVRERVVFLEDYDMHLAQELVQGVDLWLNTPRRPWEACGTSGMKLLANGGLNLSVLDGWWAEGFEPGVGWAIGGGREPHGEADDATDARELYACLEQEVTAAFYERDTRGVPQAWVQRVRRSMAELAPDFSSNRMVMQYVEETYLSCGEALRRRQADGGRAAGELARWERRLLEHWGEVRFGRWHVEPEASGLSFSVQVYLGDLDAEAVRVELYAEPGPDGPGVAEPMTRGEAVAGAVHGYVYHRRLDTQRPPEHFTPRVVAWHPEACLPGEAIHIHWQR